MQTAGTGSGALPSSAGATAHAGSAGVADSGGNKASNAGASGTSATIGASAGSSAAGASGAVAGSGEAAAGSGEAAGVGAAGADSGAAGGAAGSGGTAGSTSPTLPPPPTPDPLTWTRCTGSTTSAADDCTTLKVPLDYADPSGETIDIAVARRKARGQRIGSLLINPGGPGGSAIDFLDPFVTVLGGTLNQRFDIVAFDPRGIGQSTPLDCHSTIEALIHVDPSPDDDAEWNETDQAAATFAAECGQKYAKLLPHLATPDVARDMDQLRAALGEEQISYLGFSYGTAIGAFYVDMFPKRVRAAVLDGAVDLELSAVDMSLQQAVGFEHSLADYFAWCGKSAANCTWAGSSKPADEFARLSASIDQKPLSVGKRSVGPGEFLIGVLAPLYSGEDGYRTISSSLRGAESGDGSGILAQTDSYLDRHIDGTYGNMQEANSAVNCLDSPVPADTTELRMQAMRFQQASPTFGLATLTGLYVCAHWPVHATPPPRPKGAGAPPILVVGTTGDPATPYTWAQALATELETAVLLTHEGEGHTAYGRGDSCIDGAVNAYFLNQTVPAENMRCGTSSGTSPMQFGPNLYRFRMH